MKLYILILLLSVTSFRVMAQGNFSPYSQMGLGDIEDEFYNRTSGLSNTGIAYRSNRFLINNNPASFSALSNQFFVMETGLRGSLISYAGQPVAPASTESADITFRRLVMGIKAAKHWGTSIGLVPFSTQNYEFNSPYFIQGSAIEIANHYYQGHGSVNKAYWANSVEFFNHLSLGVDAGYLFGQLNQKDILQNFSTGASLISTTNTVNLNNIYMTYGMQFYGKIGKKWEYSLGATYANRSNLLAASTRQVQNSDSSLLQNYGISENYITLPSSYGAGIALTYKQRYTLLADFKYQDWTGVNSENSYPGKNYTLTSSYRSSVGFEISKKRNYYNNKVELSYFQSGLYYGESYLQINGTQIRDMGATVAFGANSLKSPLAYSIVFQYGIKGTTSNNLIRQNYANVTFLINYGAVWFTKGKKYD